MSSSRRFCWGPHPVFAVAPVVVAVGVAAWAWCADRDGQAPPSAVAVTAFKPLEGERAGDVPIEVLAGVPTARTLHLWQSGRPGN